VWALVGAAGLVFLLAGLAAIPAIFLVSLIRWVEGGEYGDQWAPVSGLAMMLISVGLAAAGYFLLVLSVMRPVASLFFWTAIKIW
jgi:hypothetical protein